MNTHEIGNFTKLVVTRWTFGDKHIKILVLQLSTTNFRSLLSSPSIFVGMVAPIWPFYACNSHMALLLLVSRRLLKGDGLVWRSSFAPENQSVNTRCSWILSSCLAINKFQIWHVIFREQDTFFVDQNDTNIHVALMHKRQNSPSKIKQRWRKLCSVLLLSPLCCHPHSNASNKSLNILYIRMRSAVFSTW